MNKTKRNYGLAVAAIILFIIATIIGNVRSEELPKLPELPKFTLPRDCDRDDFKLITYISPRQPTQTYLQINQGDSVLIYNMTPEQPCIR